MMSNVEAEMHLNLKNWDEVIAYMKTAIEHANHIMTLAQDYKRRGIPFPVAPKKRLAYVLTLEESGSIEQRQEHN